MSLVMVTWRALRKRQIYRASRPLPCAGYRAHGKECICRVPHEKHTANTTRTTITPFAVCRSEIHTAVIFCRGTDHTTRQKTPPFISNSTPSLIHSCLILSTGRSSPSPHRRPLLLPIGAARGLHLLLAAPLLPPSLAPHLL